MAAESESGETMKGVFMVRRPPGRERKDHPIPHDKAAAAQALKDLVKNDAWAEITYHICGHDEGVPCRDVEIVHRHGTIPDSE